MAEIELRRTEPETRREKTLLANSGSLGVMTVSIQPLEECELVAEGVDGNDESVA